MKALRQIKLTLASLLIMVMGYAGTAHAQYTAVGGYAGTLLYSHNAMRASAGLPPLSLNGQLSYAAQAKANDMVANNYWSHFSPSGLSPWSFIDASGYDYISAGENLAFGYATLSDVMSSWMNSPDHRANIMNGAYLDVGFGVANSENYVGQGPQTIIVAEYGQPAYAPAPAPAPAPATAPRATSNQPASTTASAAATAQPTDSQPADTPAPAPSQTTTAASHKSTAQKPKSTKKQKKNPSFLASIKADSGKPPITPAASQGLGLAIMGTVGVFLYGFGTRFYHVH